jgi:diguanylate cyclase (GGDEF)-like protein
LKQQALEHSLDPSPIKTAELFNCLLGDGYEYIVERSCVINLRKKARLFNIGQKAEHFYMLLKGAVRICKPREEGGDEELARYTPGDVIGDFDFARKSDYDAYAEALDNSILAMFPAIGFTMADLIYEVPHIASRILLNCVIMMTNRIKSTQNILLENFTWIKELHRRAYEDPGTGLWKHAFLADEINSILEKPMAVILLKPDRFKILVDSRGHEAGDKAMVKLASILKIFVKKLGRGWALRFKSNETGLVINKCSPKLAADIAQKLSGAISAIPPVPAQGNIPAFSFSGTIAYTVWPDDGEAWEPLFDNTYALLLETWKNGVGGTISHYSKKTADAKRGAT